LPSSLALLITPTTRIRDPDGDVAMISSFPGQEVLLRAWTNRSSKPGASSSIRGYNRGARQVYPGRAAAGSGAADVRQVEVLCQ
jgi:hypothetical protein